MDSLTEDYQLQLNNIVRLMPTDLDLALMLIKSQDINLSHVVNHMITCRVKIPGLLGVKEFLGNLCYNKYYKDDSLMSSHLQCTHKEIYDDLMKILTGLITHLQYEQ